MKAGANAVEGAVFDDPDSDLLARVARQDAAAVHALVAAKLPRLLALATRMLGDGDEAQDVAQEVFVRVWRQAPHWEPGRARFDTWMHRVALNLCHDRLRERGRWRRLDVAFDDEQAADGDAPSTLRPSLDAVVPLHIRDARTDVPERQLASRQRETHLGEAVRAALSALPVRQREALILQHYQGLSNVDAADVMGISVDALESVLARARRTMRRLLARDVHLLEDDA